MKTRIASALAGLTLGAAVTAGVTARADVPWIKSAEVMISVAQLDKATADALGDPGAVFANGACRRIIANVDGKPAAVLQCQVQGRGESAEVPPGATRVD